MILSSFNGKINRFIIAQLSRLLHALFNSMISIAVSMLVTKTPMKTSLMYLTLSSSNTMDLHQDSSINQT